jgi:hypothetical protein
MAQVAPAKSRQRRQYEAKDTFMRETLTRFCPFGKNRDMPVLESPGRPREAGAPHPLRVLSGERHTTTRTAMMSRDRPAAANAFSRVR